MSSGAGLEMAAFVRGLATSSDRVSRATEKAKCRALGRPFIGGRASARRERLVAGLAETQDAPLLAFAAERKLEAGA
jgi:hypothetical protein